MPPPCARSLGIAAVAVTLLHTLATAQSVLHSTHDWPNILNAVSGSPDGAIDCKTPGDGRTYIVGNTTVANTDPQTALFSNFPISGPPAPFQIVNGSRQIAWLQIKESNGSILQQRYFYGQTNNQPGGGLSTLVRAISVFPAATSLDTRIAICGESFDQNLPAAVTQAIPTAGNVSGFLAVYDGDATLLWSYQFYGSDPSAVTMLTDLSIRVEGLVDVITYCGNTTNGAFAGPAPSPMDPVLPYGAPASVSGCTDVPTSGNTHNAPNPTTPSGQWDGFVGRLTMPHNGPFALGPNTVAFHSLVGGDAQDSLFGLCETGIDQFVVVGSTRNVFNPLGLSRVVPLVRPTPFNQTQPFCFTSSTTQFDCFGTVFWFDAAATRTNGPLLLTDSTLIGTPGTASVARDVTGTSDRIWIVGSTNDALFTTLDPNAIDATLNNGVILNAIDGFALTHKAGANTFEHATFLGDKEDDVMTGIAQWNEYSDHAVAYGWTKTLGQKDLVIHSLFFNSYTHGQPSLPTALRLLRTLKHGGTGDEVSADTTGLTTAGTLSSTVGSLEGGGVAVDSRGRVSIVGNTISQNYPFDPNSPIERGRQPVLLPPSNDPDAVAAYIDLLPAGVCRTDGTGACNPTWSPTATYQGNGGTTPACATTAFGALLGTTPSLLRMLVDFEGVAQAGSSAYVLLDRPSFGSLLQGSVMQIGFASTSPVVIDGIEQWVTSASAVSQLYLTNYTSLRVPLGQLPPGTNSFAIQFVCFLPSALCNTPNFVYSASPALMFGY